MMFVKGVYLNEIHEIEIDTVIYFRSKKQPVRWLYSSLLPNYSIHIDNIRKTKVIHWNRYKKYHIKCKFSSRYGKTLLENKMWKKSCV